MFKILGKILRLFRAALQDTGEESGKSLSSIEDNPLYYDIISILDVTIFPSLSYLDCNCCIAEEIWNLIKLYPYQIRSIYLIFKIVFKYITQNTCSFLGIVCMLGGRMIRTLHIQT